MMMRTKGIKKEKRQQNALKKGDKRYHSVPKCLKMDQHENLIHMKTKQKIDKEKSWSPLQIL